MGQRFQGIIIDKQDGEEFRTAFHHQWMYGLTAVNMLADTVSDKEAVIGAITAGSINLRRGANLIERVEERIHDITEESITDDYTMGDNDDGVFILDMRDPESTKYAMIVSGGADRRISSDMAPKCDDDGLWPHRPSTWKQYALGYYEDDVLSEMEEWLATIASQMEGTSLLTSADLHALFPDMSKPRVHAI